MDSPEGNFEFMLPGDCPKAAFFPMTVSFKSQGTYSGIQIATVADQDGSSLEFASSVNLEVERYEVQE